MDMLFELSQRGYAVPELPLPIVPKFGRDLRPIARRMRNELFSISNPRVFHSIKDRNAKTAGIGVNARTDKCAAHIIGAGFCPTEPRLRSRLESRRKVCARYRRANECNHATPGNSVPRLRAFQNPGSSTA